MMNKRVWVGAALLALLGCGQNDGADQKAIKQAALERIMGLPLCGDLERASEPFDAVDCRLNPAGGDAPSEEQVLVSFEPVEAGAEAGRITIRLTRLDGTELQAFTEADVPVYLYPRLEDFNGDGALDVVVSREIGNVNTVMALWKRQKDKPQFDRLGEVNGVSLERTARGELAVPARSSASAWGVSFYDMQGSALLPLALLRIEALDGAATKSTCALEDISEAALARQTREVAQAYFCAEPASRVYEE